PGTAGLGPGGRPPRPAEAQSAVFLDVATGTRARRGVSAWQSRRAAGDIRTGLAAAGTRAATRGADPAQQPYGIDGRKWRPRRRSSAAGGTRRGATGGDDAQIGGRRWHGLFVVFRRLDRGANARGHDAVCLDRRAARLSRSARLSWLYFGRNSRTKIKHRCSCQLSNNAHIFGKE